MNNKNIRLLANTFLRDKLLKFIRSTGLIILVILFTLILSQYVFADSAANNSIKSQSQELQNISKKIKGLVSNLSADQNQKQSMQQQLKPIEVSIGKIANNLAHINSKIEQEQQVLQQLNQQRQQYTQQLRQQKRLLAQQVKSAYMLGKNQYIKILLNQDQPQNISRLLVYYRYLNLARIQMINALNQTLTDLADNQHQIQTQTDDYQHSLSEEQQQQSALQKHYSERQIVISQLTQQINTKSEKLSQLKANEAALENLITKLKQQAATAAPALVPKVPFAEMEGKLPWPTKGPIVRNFGYAIDTSGTTYNGVLISAPQGQPIYAVYPGQVVFANWLSGVGLLVIIQHGEDFMTLYGHAYSLMVKTGQYVEQGQEIGTVGQSGGYATTGLFFQIRHDGTPVNPQYWCR